MSEHTKLTGPLHGLADLRHAALINCIGNRCLNLPTTTLEDGDKNDLETQGVAIEFSVDGVSYSKAALADTNVVVVAANAFDGVIQQAKGTTCYYVLTLQADGTLTCYKGEDDEATRLPGHALLECAFCVIKVITTSAVTFDFGVTDFDASGVTTTFKDVTCLPATAP